MHIDEFQIPTVSIECVSSIMHTGMIASLDYLYFPSLHNEIYYRDDAQNKIQTLAERNQKEQEQHHNDMIELMRQIADEEKRWEFMLAKANDREDYILEEEEKKRRQGLHYVVL